MGSNAARESATVASTVLTGTHKLMTALRYDLCLSAAARSNLERTRPVMLPRWERAVSSAAGAQLLPPLQVELDGVPV